MPGTVYQLRVKGYLPDAWEGELDHLKLCYEGDGCTSITGAVTDQAALHGLLARIRDLGLELVSVNQVGCKCKER